MVHRVVVTGIGIVSPLGLDTESTWQAILRGESGVDYITAFDPAPFETKFAAEVKGFDPLNHMDRKDARRTDRFTQFAIAAARESLKNAHLDLSKADPHQVGIIVGSGIGGIITLSEQFKVLFERGPDRVSPFLVPMMIVDMAGGYLSILLGAKGAELLHRLGLRLGRGRHRQRLRDSAARGRPGGVGWGRRGPHLSHRPSRLQRRPGDVHP